jgi:sulfur relay (sulfurtransferase) complex TusBCD TusD component (DsrE family)
MALSLAHNALRSGHQPVTIFLNVRGVYLADQERLPATEGNSDLNIHQRVVGTVNGIQTLQAAC